MTSSCQTAGPLVTKDGSDSTKLRCSAKFRPAAIAPPANGWLRAGPLDRRQVAALDAVYEQRKEIARELPKLVVDPEFDVRMDLLNDAVECLSALGQFWGSIELDSDPGVRRPGRRSSADQVGGIHRGSVPDGDAGQRRLGQNRQWTTQL